MVGEAKQAEDRVPTLGASAGAGAVGAESMGPGQGGGAELWGPPPSFRPCQLGPGDPLEPHLPLPPQSRPCTLRDRAPCSEGLCWGPGVIYCGSFLLLPVTCPLSPGGF